MKPKTGVSQVPTGKLKDVVFLTVLPDSFEPHCCGRYGEEILCCDCQKTGVEFCPADYYSGDPENPFLPMEGIPAFEVRIAQCEGALRV
ncbi:MAG: hypothetical protein Q8L09_03445 [Candidatus Moranbacteria bacterium]|nr:hypothetical protein [Candidatus Moranbacteria bacterium]